MSGHHLPRFIVVVPIDFGEPLRTLLLVFFSRLPLLSVEIYVSLKLHLNFVSTITLKRSNLYPRLSPLRQC